MKKKILLLALGLLIIFVIIAGAGAVWIIKNLQGFRDEFESSYGDIFSEFPSCEEEQEIFTTAPVDPSELTTIVPLGNFNPTGHVFPTRHLYFAPVQDADLIPKALDLVSPAHHMWIISIRASENLTKGRTDYSLYFAPCRQVQGYFHHVQTLSERLQKELVPPYDSEETYTTGGDTFHAYSKEVKIEVSAGEVLGTVGGNPGVSAFDFGLTDFRITPLNAANPDRWSPDGRVEDSEQLHAVCAIDYFTSDLKAVLEAKLGDWSGNPRTTPPICGEVMQDAKGTAAGVWFLKGTTETYPEDPHLALVHSNFDVRLPVFSVGTSLQKSGLPPGVYEFIPRRGMVDMSFDDVFPDGKVYCYDLRDFQPTAVVSFDEDPSKIRYSVILQLLDEKTLRVEKLNQAPCGSGPWGFTSLASEFER